MTYDQGPLAYQDEHHVSDGTLVPYLGHEQALEQASTPLTELALSAQVGLRAVKLTFWCGLLTFNFYALMMMLWAWVALLVHLASGLPWTAPLSLLALGIATTLALSFGLKVTSGYVLDSLGKGSVLKAIKQLAP